MDTRTRQIIENYENHTLGLDDSFKFKCRACGKCCKNRTDIILTTRDLYNIAKELDRTHEDVIERYCEAYIGGSSRIPIVRLRAIGSEKACPLLRDKRCVVHKAKPVVCALFPLGRAAPAPAGQTEPQNIRPRYFFQPATCGSEAHTHTVRSWLEQFGIPAEDEFYTLWTHAICFLSTCLSALEEGKVSERTMEMLWNAVFASMYVHYDTALDFMTQFRNNVSKLKKVLTNINSEAESFRGGAADGK
jgi:Fe-S-cluster containining protein